MLAFLLTATLATSLPSFDQDLKMIEEQLRPLQDFSQESSPQLQDDIRQAFDLIQILKVQKDPKLTQKDIKKLKYLLKKIRILSLKTPKNHQSNILQPVLLHEVSGYQKLHKRKKNKKICLDNQDSPRSIRMSPVKPLQDEPALNE